MTKRQLTSQIKKWRTANPTGSRLAFCAYLIAIDQEPPPTGELMTAWRTIDAQRTIDQPATVADAIAIIIQDGLHTDRGLDAYRYLVECGQANEDLLLSIA